MKIQKYIGICILTIVSLMVVCMFTACGDDEKDDVLSNDDNSIVYIEPCFNWGASIEEVKSWMTTKPFELYTDRFMLLYVKSDGSASISYMFNGNIQGLYFSQVTYEATDDVFLSSLISQTEKRYNTTLKKSQNDKYSMYTGNAVVGGRMVGIIITPGKDKVEIIFAVPE